MKAFTLIVVLLCFGAAQAQTSEVELLKKANLNLVSAFQNKKFDDALKFAQEALNLSLKIYGADNKETALSHSNLGAVYRIKQKYKEASQNFRKAAEVYGRQKNENGKELIKIYQDLAEMLIADNETEEAEEIYLKVLKISETTFKPDSKETLNVVFSIAKFYTSVKRLDDSDRFYLRCYELVIKNFGKDTPQIEIIDDERVLSNVGTKERQAKFNAEKQKYFGTDDGTIINGRVLKLAEPEYPPAAKSVRASGNVVVKLYIDEKGDVENVKVLSGHPLLRGSAEKAALKSKFLPPLKNGNPIKLKGYIIYNFDDYR